jgi:D-hexose-6-phosphate mutarotase
MAANLEPYHRHQLPGRVAIVAGNGGLPKLVITTPASQAEIYAHGAHITHFQKPGEPPLLFLSQRSRFAPGQPIRGGVPICFPWFGGRAGEPSHGFARLTEWQLVHTAAAPDGTVTVRFALPDLPGRAAWKSLRTGFTVIVGDTLAMELAVTNESGETLDFENCLHTYFHVSDIASVSLTGLQQTAFLDNAAGGRGERKIQAEASLRIPAETNRIYLDTTGPVEIRDEQFSRVVRVEKSGSQSTVVWNPWTTQKLPEDFDPAEYRNMVCVEAGNLKQSRIALAPGQTSALKVILHSQKWQAGPSGSQINS